MNRLLRLLGSMPFAVGVLAVVAIAASIGSLVEQNQPLAADVGRYGLLWATSFRLLGLHDIYHAGWFLALLGFLTFSTGLCVWRQTPGMWREARGFKHHLGAEALRRLPATVELQLSEGQKAQLPTALRAGRWRWVGDGLTLSATKGQLRRLGYVATHLAIVVISVGGLADANLGLQLRLAAGRLHAAPLEQPPSELSPASRLGPDSGAFRGALRLAEGGSGDQASLAVADGYLLRRLPVAVHLRAFRVETHPGGQPSDFVSEIEITDPARPGTAFPLRVAMNAPARYGRLQFYQSGFDDGGSSVRGAWLLQGGLAHQPLQAQVGVSQALLLDGRPLTAELTGYKPRNLVAPDAPATRGWHEAFLSGAQAAQRVDLGPSLELRLRDDAGQTLTETVYVKPVRLDGRAYAVFGLAEASGEARFLRLPIDERGSLGDYRRLLAALADPATLHAFATGAPPVVAQALPHALAQFRRGGLTAVGDASNQRVLIELLSRLALHAWSAEHPGQPPAEGLAFVTDALLAYSHWIEAGKPALLQVDEVTPVAASVLQVSEAPGAAIVYLGMALLALGAALMVLCPERRLWVRESPQGVLIALAAHRPLDGLPDELHAFTQLILKESP
ncbi:cytochrome c biogenesis protein ResB [Roseateles sp. DXS20W]|uniref:Cytochrome c biogenesis protein ResB n=1 Tax=Pelomonas lactea TaxID=3299030 RepID=A0ABW7GJS1_9BURK